VLLILGLGLVGNMADQHIQDIERTKRDLETTLALVESANRAKSDFLATMSHELRTPLNAVIGFSEMIIRGHRNYKEYARDIHDSGSHLLQIINDILDLSKAESGNLTLSESKVDCRAIIVASVRLIRPRLQKADLTLDLKLPDDLPVLWADSRLIKQVVLNLLSNAVKFTQPRGRIDVDVTADSVAGLAIAIQDNGVGIANADLVRVRQPFVQVDSSLNRSHEGTGLGLPLVERIMHQHGGTFELESELGKGTTARVLFPTDRLIWANPGEQVSDSAVHSSSSQSMSLPVDRTTAKSDVSDEKIHLLVVEDDRDLCELLCRMLERAGFATAGASTGREALRHLRKEPVDILITDILMPEMDGIELMRVLRTERPDLPVIALSGTEDAMEYGRIAGHLGAWAALLKPIESKALVSAVQDVLARTRSDDTIRWNERAAKANAGN
jgi:CheY-like chemotaxis protein/anti-sigma regulatory factor (Ser/Thr protein kinase)